MTSYISWGIISINLIFPLISPFFCFWTISMMTQVLPIKWKTYHFHRSFFTALGQLVIGIIVEIILLFNRLKKNDLSTEQMIIDPQNRQFTRVKRRENKEMLNITLLVLLSSFLDYFGFTGILYALYLLPYTAAKTTLIMIQIIYATIICCKFLKFSLYIHHAVAFSIMILGYGIIVSGAYDLIINGRPVYVLFLSLIPFLLFSTREAIEKYMMDKKYCRPFALLAIEGIFGIMASCVLITVFSSIQCEGFFKDIELCNPLFQREQIASFKMFTEMFTDTPQTWWMFFLLTIPGGGFSGFTKLTNYHYSPIHRTVSDVISSSIYMICFESQILPTYKLILQMIGNLILLFGLLVYIEFIVLYILDLDKNTKKEIIKRANNEGKVIDNSEFELSRGLSLSITE